MSDKILIGQNFRHPWKISSLLSDEKFCPTKILCNVEISNSHFFSITFLIRWAKSREKKPIYKIFLKLVFWQNKHSLESQSSIDIVSNHFGGFLLTVGSTTSLSSQSDSDDSQILRGFLLTLGLTTSLSYSLSPSKTWFAIKKWNSPSSSSSVSAFTL